MRSPSRVDRSRAQLTQSVQQPVFETPATRALRGLRGLRGLRDALAVTRNGYGYGLPGIGLGRPGLAAEAGPSSTANI